MNIKANFITHSDSRELDIDEEHLVQGHISSSLISHEKALFATKWFDYRFMSPFQATMLYIDDFAEISRRIYRREIDMERSEKMHFPSSERVKYALSTGTGIFAKTKGDKSRLTKSWFTGYWRGRQVADALGMPYATFIELAMGYRMREWDRASLPQPTQLYLDRFVEKVQERWIELQDAGQITAEHHAYMHQNYIGLSAQNDYHEYLITGALKSHNRNEALAQLVIDDLVPLSKIESRLTGEEFERVSEYLA